jgi:hypothetical protein
MFPWRVMLVILTIMLGCAATPLDPSDPKEPEHYKFSASGRLIQNPDGSTSLPRDNEKLLSLRLWDLFEPRSPPSNVTSYFATVWQWEPLRRRLDDPHVNTTLLVYTNKPYEMKRMEQGCYWWVDQFKLDSLLDCSTIQNFLGTLMLPFPIPEKTRVLNSWGATVSWRREKGQDFLYPLHHIILEKQQALNGELWLLGDQTPMSQALLTDSND